jgi:hypothetical protein
VRLISLTLLHTEVIADSEQDNVTHMTITRQRLCKHIPEVTLSTIEGRLLPGNGSLNTFPQERISTQSERNCWKW